MTAGVGVLVSRKSWSRAVVGAVASMALISGDVEADAKEKGAALSIAPTILVVHDTPIPLAVQAKLSSEQRARAFLHVEGLPREVKLSPGRLVAPDLWVVPVSELSRLTVSVPPGMHDVEITFRLMVEASSGVAAQSRQKSQPKAATAKLVAQGERLMEGGNIGSARRFLQRAAEAGDGKAALLLSRSYEADELRRLKVRGLHPDAEQATRWKQMAEALQAPPPVQQADLKSLGEQTTRLTMAPAGLYGSVAAAPAPAPRTASSDGRRATGAQLAASAPAAPVVDVQKMIHDGDRNLGGGRIAQARQFFKRAADAGNALGALRLAQTYDPHELERINARGLQSNIAEARKWYSRARELGASIAGERIMMLESR